MSALFLDWDGSIFNLGWIERVKNSRAVVVTATGREGLAEFFKIGLADALPTRLSGGESAQYASS